MNTLGINMRQLEIEMARAALFELAVGIIILIVLFWASYYVIKAGVRDGIRESGLRNQPGQRPAAPQGYRWALVPETEHTKELRAD